MGNDVSIEADEIKTRFAVEILRAHKPQFMTVHLSSLDESEHDHGPFSSEANAHLEAIDGMLSRLVAAARANDSKAIAVVASDHGFEALEHRVNLFIPFIQAGLIRMSSDAAGRASVVSWRAEPWLAGGMAAVMLHDPADQRTADRVRGLLARLAADEESGIAEILDQDAIEQRGAFPGARFLIVMRPGYYAGSALDGALVTDFKGHGGHGFTPESPEMRSALLIEGAGIARHRDLGVIDMRQIAPTVASLLGVELPGARMALLPVRQ
jgi:predicted AlkP superfamily pyrophosphatase or phosphodiesterase